MSNPPQFVVNPPPNGPAPPSGWTPPAGWQPDPLWGPAPDGWEVWRVADAAQVSPAPTWAAPPAATQEAMTPSPPTMPLPETASLPPAAAMRQQTPLTTTPVMSPGGGRSWFARHKVLSGIGGVLVFLMFLTAVSGAGSDEDNSTDVNLAATDADPAVDKVTADKAAAETAAAETAAAATAAADKAAADKAAAAKAAADKAVAAKAAAEKAAADKAAVAKAAAEKAAESAKGTPSQQNAYDAAVDYLDLSAFSRIGLTKQLSSEFGSQFPAADAEFAVSRLERQGEVDWNAEAAEAAKDYLELSSFSRQGLLDQLTSEFGSQFTPAQAKYGVNQTGL